MGGEVASERAADVEREVANSELLVEQLQRLQHSKDRHVGDGRAAKVGHRLLKEERAAHRLREERVELLPTQLRR